MANVKKKFTKKNQNYAFRRTKQRKRRPLKNVSISTEFKMKFSKIFKNNLKKRQSNEKVKIKRKE